MLSFVCVSINGFSISGKTIVNELMLPLLTLRPYDTPPIGNAWAELSKDELKSEISKLEKQREVLSKSIKGYLDRWMGDGDGVGELINSLRSEADDLAKDLRAAKAELERRPKDFDEVLDEIYKLRNRSRVFISRVDYNLRHKRESSGEDQAELDKLNETINRLIAEDLPTTRPTLKRAKNILRDTRYDFDDLTHDLENDKHVPPAQQMGEVQEKVLSLMREDAEKIIRVLEKDIIPFV
mgnify:CR=1 FL=1